MKKKKGIIWKIIIAVIVLGFIGSALGGKDDKKEVAKDPTPQTQSQQLNTEKSELVKQEKPQVSEPNQEAPKPVKTPATEPKPENPPKEAKPVQQEPEKEENKTSGIRKELKDFLASYESFMDEYCNFMANYNMSDPNMLTKYMQILNKYTDFAEKADKWEDNDLNNEELLYYTEVLNRVSQKLLKVGLSM